MLLSFTKTSQLSLFKSREKFFINFVGFRQTQLASIKVDKLTTKKFNLYEDSKSGLTLDVAVGVGHAWYEAPMATKKSSCNEYVHTCTNATGQ